MPAKKLFIFPFSFPFVLSSFPLFSFFSFSTFLFLHFFPLFLYSSIFSLPLKHFSKHFPWVDDPQATPLSDSPSLSCHFIDGCATKPFFIYGSHFEALQSSSRLSFMNFRPFLLFNSFFFSSFSALQSIFWSIFEDFFLLFFSFLFFSFLFFSFLFFSFLFFFHG